MAIELRHITKSYGSQIALKNINLSIDDGEFITLLGPSGCGKTTLLRAIAGFTKPDQGEIILGGKVITQLPANQRQIGMLFQSYALFPHMTVADNVSFGLRMRGLSRRVQQKEVNDVLSLVGMQQFRDRYPAQLSGGQQQRVALARTLVIKPRLLLLDEPLAALDRKLRLQMQIDLKKLIQQINITTLFVTHDQEEAMTMSDKIAVMDRGIIVQYGTPMEVYDYPQTPFVASFVGDSNLLTGILTPDPDGSLVFEAEELRFKLPQSAAPWSSEAATVKLLLRPEHLELSEISHSATAMPGVISFMTQSGNLSTYEVKLKSGHFLKVGIARSRNQPSLSEGTPVFVSPVDSFAYWVVPIK